MPNPPSLNIVYDLAVKQFEFVDRAYDTLTTRAASLIGWTSFVASITIAVQKNIVNTPWLSASFSVWTGALASLSIAFALRAYWTRDVHPWPDSESVYNKYSMEPEDSTRAQMLANIQDIAKKNRALVDAKAKNVKVSTFFMSILGGTLTLFLFATILLPNSPTRSDTCVMANEKGNTGNSGTEPVARPSAVPLPAPDQSVAGRPLTKSALDGGDVVTLTRTSTKKK
jgi:hypothetical protein